MRLLHREHRTWGLVTLWTQNAGKYVSQTIQQKRWKQQINAKVAGVAPRVAVHAASLPSLALNPSFLIPSGVLQQRRLRMHSDALVHVKDGCFFYKAFGSAACLTHCSKSPWSQSARRWTEISSCFTETILQEDLMAAIILNLASTNDLCRCDMTEEGQIQYSACNFSVSESSFMQTMGLVCSKQCCHWYRWICSNQLV